MGCGHTLKFHHYLNLKLAFVFEDSSNMSAVDLSRFCLQIIDIAWIFSSSWQNYFSSAHLTKNQFSDTGTFYLGILVCMHVLNVNC